MKTASPNPSNRPSSGAALLIVLAFVVLLTVLVVAYFSRTATDRQLAQSSFNVTGADLLARSAIDIVVNDLKQEIANNPTVTAANIQPQRYGNDPSVPNLIRRSFSGDPTNRTSNISSTAASANGRALTLARWNSHYLIPTGSNFTAPDWVLITPQGPNSAPAPGAVIGRYAYAVYDEGGLIDINLGGFPTYASLTPRARRSIHRLRYPSEESEIILVAGQPPKISSKLTDSGTVGTAYTYSIKANQNPTSYNATPLPAGLNVNTATGVVSGTPGRPGRYNISISATNAAGSDTQTLALTIGGAVSAASTPWPVNLARKGTVAFADLSVLPSNPVTTSAQINQIMGWRNHATTQQAQTASFNSPSFPPDLTHEEYFASYFLGSGPPFTTPFTTVSTTVASGRTDQAIMTRQELIKLQRTIGFSQDLLQYLGTSSREQNRPAPNWPGLNGNLSTRWDMNNLSIMIPDTWYRKGNGVGHQWGVQKHSQIGQLFGLIWANGDTVNYPRTDPRYWGRWLYNIPGHTLNPGGALPANPDFFQIIGYAMNKAIGVNDANAVANTFNVGAALIDQYDSDDLNDTDNGNTITIIVNGADDGTASHYFYGIENMSFDSPAVNLSRPPSAPYPPPVPSSYVLLNRRFENVGEFGYAYNPGSSLSSKTLDFFTAASKDAAILDFFTYNTASPRAGIVNLNTRNAPVLASIIRGAVLNDPGSENTPVALVTQADALTAGQAIVNATTAAGGAAVNRKDVARLAAAAVAAVPALATSDETKRTIARTLAEVGQARTWNLMIDVIAQTGRYTPGTADLTDPSKFIVQGEKRYWLHIALDRDDGTVLGQQVEEVTE